MTTLFYHHTVIPMLSRTSMPHTQCSVHPVLLPEPPPFCALIPPHPFSSRLPPLPDPSPGSSASPAPTPALTPHSPHPSPPTSSSLLIDPVIALPSPASTSSPVLSGGGSIYLDHQSLEGRIGMRTAHCGVGSAGWWRWRRKRSSC